MSKPILELKNFGRSTHVIICGLDVSRGITGASLVQMNTNLGNPELTVTVDIREMLRGLSEITPIQLEQAKEIIKPYLIGYEKAVTDDRSRSMEVLR